MTSFYSKNELNSLLFKSLGENVLISRFAHFYDIENIEIGNNVRIDDFCILSGKIKIGNYIHISAYSALYGKYGIVMEDFSGLSPRCIIFSAIDDFSGEYMIGPLVDAEFRNITCGIVNIKKYSQLGCNCIVFPGVTIDEGVSVGAMSLITKNLEPWRIYAGIPAKYLKDRSKNLVKYLNTNDS